MHTLGTGMLFRMCFDSSCTNQSGRSSSLNVYLFQAASIMSLFIFFDEAIIVPKARPLSSKTLAFLFFFFLPNLIIILYKC